jgi:hypothetical protein
MGLKICLRPVRAPKTGCGLVRHVQAFAVVVGGEEDVILDVCIYCLAKDRLQVYVDHSVDQLRRPGIFKPVLGRLDGIGFYPRRPIGGGCLHRGLQGAGARGVAVAGEGAGSLGALGYDDRPSGTSSFTGVVNKKNGDNIGVVDQDPRDVVIGGGHQGRAVDIIVVSEIVGVCPHAGLEQDCGVVFGIPSAPEIADLNGGVLA